MRAAIDPLYLTEIVMERMTMLDQLTVVRNYVRKGFDAHRRDVNGEFVTEVSVEVGWLNGDIETLVFDKFVGYPVQIDGKKPDRDWMAEWRSETLSEDSP